jgi:glutathione S-transferase
MHELLGLPYSPWSEKAKWALDVRRVPYRYRVYQPLVGEPALRIKTRRFRGKVTVPILVDDRGVVYDDSAKIARFANARGEGPALFPKEQEVAIDHWIDIGERGLAAGRALSLERALQNEEALAELVPWRLRKGPLRGIATRIGEFGVQRTLRKYGARAQSPEAHRKAVRASLDELRGALATSRSTPKTVLGIFTFADIAAAQILSFVSPPAFGLKLGKTNRRNFFDPELAREYADLLEWRDALYDTYRPRG